MASFEEKKCNWGKLPVQQVEVTVAWGPFPPKFSQWSNLISCKFNVNNRVVMRSYCIHIALLAICFLTRTDATADSPADLYRSRSCWTRERHWGLQENHLENRLRRGGEWRILVANVGLRLRRANIEKDENGCGCSCLHTRVVQRIKMTLRYIFFCSKDAQCWKCTSKGS